MAEGIGLHTGFWQAYCRARDTGEHRERLAWLADNPEEGQYLHGRIIEVSSPDPDEAEKEHGYWPVVLKVLSSTTGAIWEVWVDPDRGGIDVESRRITEVVTAAS